MNLFFTCFGSGASFLLAFLLYLQPAHLHVKANRWLSFFVFLFGCAFLCTYMINTDAGVHYRLLFKCLYCLQFLLAPSLYISILHFVKPNLVLGRNDWMHGIPFLFYVFFELIWNFRGDSISTYPIFAINEKISFWVRDILPFISLFYLIKSYQILVKHKGNRSHTLSSIKLIPLDWLIQFLGVLSFSLIVWMNDALFGLPILTGATNYAYCTSIFFLAYFSIRQKSIFPFKATDEKDISGLFESKKKSKEISGGVKNHAEKKQDPLKTSKPVQGKPQRLSESEFARLSRHLTDLMEQDKLFLDNDLSLPTVAEKLGISIHEASFLINESTQNNFYKLINTYRVEEAKRLLRSSKMSELNLLGIAFAAGFNSKTTFNTTFKNSVGQTPSQYFKAQNKAVKHVRLDKSEP